MKVLVLGATGFLGDIVQKVLSATFEVIGTTTSDFSNDSRQVHFRYSGKDSINRLLAKIQPVCIVNCIALADVERAEADPKLADFLNFQLPLDLSVACQERGIKLIHISTDHFESSIGGLDEDDLPNPVNVYGQTKLAGDIAILNNCNIATVLRTNFFARSKLGDKGLIDFVINSYQVSRIVSGYRDVFFNPVGAHFLAGCIEKLITTNHYGILNICSTRPLSKFDFLCLVAQKMHFDETIISARDYSEAPGAIMRPRFMSLNPSRFQDFLGIELPSIESQLDLELSGTITLRTDKDGK